MTEFIMKDIYSFHQDTEDLDKYYDKVKEAYFKKTFLSILMSFFIAWHIKNGVALY
jgi:prolyl-tRNA synthetase